MTCEVYLSFPLVEGQLMRGLIAHAFFGSSLEDRLMRLLASNDLWFDCILNGLYQGQLHPLSNGILISERALSQLESSGSVVESR